ncbi:hypothetical protein BU17DRAFT_96845 [Hysterangium stoloniferum]|nr:hypothetical protein BU17DRAFT_96845 [Hysterangium stoloniferum]
MFIPEKYWPFIDSNVRRVYFDGESGVSQDRVAQLEERVMSLEGQKELLMDSCERYMLAADAHAEKEKEARLQCDRLQKELQTANMAVQKLIQNELQRIKADRARHVSQRDKDPSCENLLENQQERATAHSRTRECFVEVPLPPSTPKRKTTILNNAIIMNKPSVPLPKRRRVSRPA